MDQINIAACSARKDQRAKEEAVCDSTGLSAERTLTRAGTSHTVSTEGPCAAVRVKRLPHCQHQQECVLTLQIAMLLVGDGDHSV